MNAIKEAHYNLGIAYLEAGQYNRAVPEFEAAIKLDADFIGAHCALCRAYLEQDELEKASTLVTAALKLDATHQPARLLCNTITQAYYDRGKEYLNTERYTEAVSTFQKALTFDADLEGNSQVSDIENKHIYAHLGAAYIRLKAYQEAIDALQSAIALDADLVDAHYNLGYAYVEQGYYDKAIPHLERAIVIAPNLKRTHYNLARAHRELGNLEAATHAITETLRLDPNYQRAHELANSIKQAHYNKGITYLNDERYSEAITAFQNAITLDPDFTTAHYNLGLTYLKMEIYPRAVDALQKTVTLDRSYKAAHHALALAYLGQQELGKARDAARDALKLDPNYQPVRSLLEAIDPSFTPTESQVAASSVDKAETAANTAPNIDPNPQPADQPLGEVRQAQLPQSTQPAIPSNVTDVKKHYERGEAFLKNKQYNEAAAAFRRAIKEDPNFAEAHYGLGVAYLELGALDDAKAAAEEASKLKADRQLVLELLTAIKVVEKSLRRRKVWKKVLSYAAVLGAIVAAILVIRWIWPEPDSVDTEHKKTTQMSQNTNKDTQNKNTQDKNTQAAIPDPAIEVEVSLEEPSSSKNGVLDAGENARIMLVISNKGRTVRNVELKLQPFEPPSTPELHFTNTKLISELSQNKIETIRIPIRADKKVQERDQVLQIQLFGKDRTLLTTKNYSFQISQ